MPWPLRPIGDRLVYHVINRGNNRAVVFHGDEDDAAFHKQASRKQTGTSNNSTLVVRGRYGLGTRRSQFQRSGVPPRDTLGVGARLAACS